MFRTILTLAFCLGMGSALRAEHSVAGLTFQAPSHWQSVTPSSPMRLAQWSVASSRAKEPGEAAVFYFGNGQGGDTASNVQRWLRSISTPEGGRVDGVVTEKTSVGKLKVTEVVAYGTYTGGIPTQGAPPILKPGFGLVGVIVEGPQGNVFFRFTGPESVVKANLASIRELVSSVRVVK